MMPRSLLLKSLLFVLATNSLTSQVIAWMTSSPASPWSRQWTRQQALSNNDNNNHANTCTASADVSDLGLTMDDLEAPLPSELLQGLATSGYESTSRISTVEDQGCQWTENTHTVDATLTIPGLRGQPAACLTVDFSTTTATVTAFGRGVWSCVLRGQVDPDRATFSAQDGPDMIPVIQVSVPKATPNERWGGFLEQIGEDSIL